MAVLDNRELAICVWITIFLIWVLRAHGVRESLKDLLASAFKIQILSTLFLAISYLVVINICLFYVGLWTVGQLKVSIFWLIFVGIKEISDISKISQDPKQLRAFTVAHLKLSLALDFFINLYGFPFFVELIFVPFMALISGLFFFAQNEEKYQQVEKLISWVMVVIVVGILSYEVYMLVNNFNKIAHKDTIRNFILPIIYPILFVPFLWLLSIYVAYEGVFARLEFILGNKQLSEKAKYRLAFSFRTNISQLNDWFRYARSKDISSLGELEETIRMFSNSERV